jgi:hypothetical protein
VSLCVQEEWSGTGLAAAIQIPTSSPPPPSKHTLPSAHPPNHPHPHPPTCGNRFNRGSAPITTRRDRSKAGRYDPSGGSGLLLLDVVALEGPVVVVVVVVPTSPPPVCPVAPLRR